MADIGGDLSVALAREVLANTHVADLAGNRVYPDVMPQGVDYPAATYESVSGMPAYHLSGEAGIATERVQFNCHALTKRESRRLARKCRDAISGRQFSRDGVYVRSCLQENVFTTEIPRQNGADGVVYVTAIDFVCNYKEA